MTLIAFRRFLSQPSWRVPVSNIALRDCGFVSGLCKLFPHATKFSSRQVGDLHATVLMSLCPDITDISFPHEFGCNPLTDDAVTALLAQHYPEMAAVNLSWCAQLTTAAWIALARGCPGLKTVACKEDTQDDGDYRLHQADR